MKRHTNKHFGIFGLMVLGLVMAGAAVSVPTWAVSTTVEPKEVEVQFTFNSAISLTVDQATMAIENLASGTTGESNEINLTVETNDVSGYYVSATVGDLSKGADLINTDLTSEDPKLSGFKIAHLTAEGEGKALSEFADNTWGVACAKGTAAYAEKAYVGFPKDGNDNGQSGKKILDENSLNGEKKVKCKVGVKVGPTLAAGTYQNKINFYAVAK